MSDPFLEGLLTDRQHEKVENFEVSTIKLVLTQLGLPRRLILRAEGELESRFGWDWFNSLNEISFVGYSTRVFKYNLLDLMDNKSSHPLTQAYIEAATGRVESNQTFHCIVKCSTYGRLVLSSVDDLRRPAIRVPLRTSKVDPDILGTGYYVQPFAGYFSDRYGSVFDETTDLGL